MKQKLTNIKYNDITDVVILRYWMLHTLVLCADEYRNAKGTGYSFKLLQQHKKLEQFDVVIKEKSRKNTACKEDFEQAKLAVLECLEGITNLQAFVSAA